MAELVLIKAIVGSRAATVLCPKCGRISRQILSKSYDGSIKADLLREEYECPLCKSTYRECNSALVNNWTSAVLRYNRDADAYNQSVRENYWLRQKSNPAVASNNTSVTTPKPGVPTERGGIQSLISVLEQHSDKVKTSIPAEEPAPGKGGTMPIVPPQVPKKHVSSELETGKNLPVISSATTAPVTDVLMDEALSRKTARWKRELLDTSKRNRMINYRETSRATLRILEPDAATLFNKLAFSEKPLTFQKPINKDTDLRTYSMIALMETLSYSLNVQVGDIKTSGTIIERERTLKNLRSKAKLAQEEQGTNTLYLCFGFIYWREHERESSPWLKAPLLMMPVSLGLKSLNAPYTLSRARFAPVKAWEKLISYIARWITGVEPVEMPAPAVQYDVEADLSDDAAFDGCRRVAIKKGIHWLEQFLVDEGRGGIREGLSHKIDPEGNQAPLNNVRNDCSGEAAGAFGLYAHVFGEAAAGSIADNLDSFTYGTMMIRDGLFDGFMRWSDAAWEVCYQDDVARCILSGLYKCLFLGDDRVYPEICRALDAMAKLTARDGCRKPRFDMPDMTEESFAEHRAAECSSLSVHHNSYLLAAFLLAYRYKKNPVYLEIGRRGLETLMAAYPETELEHSETQEKCRLVFPLAALYDATKDEKHREMLYRVVADLEKVKHPSGGYYEWDTEYRAKYSRVSSTECSLLTENGDPVADLLYSVNWLPIGFAYAYYATGDEWFRQLWKDIVGFCLKTQIVSDDPLTNGSWCRAFDMERGEVYGCPHDEGWAPYASETGWTVAEILMGMMFMDILQNRDNKK